MKVTLALVDGTVLRTWHSYGAWASGAPGVRPGGSACGRDNCNEHNDVVADLAIRLSESTTPFVEAMELAAAAAAAKQTRAARQLHRLAVKFWPRSQPDAWHGPWCLRGCDGVIRPPLELDPGYRESLLQCLRDRTH